MYKVCNSKIVKFSVIALVLLMSINIRSINADVSTLLDFTQEENDVDNMLMDIVDTDSIDDPVAPNPDDNDESVTGKVEEVSPEYVDSTTMFNGNVIFSCDTFIENEMDDELGYVSVGSNYTNQNVTVTLVGLDSDVFIVNNEGNPEYVFEQNGDFTFEVSNFSGETSSFYVMVDFINKDTPIAVLTYETIDEYVVASISLYSLDNKEIIMLNNDGEYTYTFIENGSFTFEYIDVYGNLGVTKAVVDTFIEEDDSLLNNDELDDYNDVLENDEQDEFIVDNDQLESFDELDPTEEQSIDDLNITLDTSQSDMTPYTHDRYTYSKILILAFSSFISFIVISHRSYVIIKK